MTGDRSIKETFLAACRALDAAEVPYVVVGAFAVSAWGRPRSTEDIDVILEVDQAKVEALVLAFGERDLTLRGEDLEAALREGSHATVFDERSIYHVDLRPATDADTRRTLSSSEQVELHGETIPVASPEETIAHKLLYASEQDIQDAEGIYARQADRLDRAILARRCKQLGVLEELRALEDRVESVLEDEG